MIMIWALVQTASRIRMRPELTVEVFAMHAPLAQMEFKIRMRPELIAAAFATHV
jgi:hypothetical protein